MRNMQAARIWAILTLLPAAATAAVAAPKSPMGKPVEYPHAGIALAVPKDFRPQNLREPFDVMSAVLSLKGKSVQAVNLSAFPVDASVTAETFAAEMAAELKKSLAIRRLKVLKTVPMDVAGTKGVGQSLKYAFRGIRTAAARVYFLRKLSAAKERLCYVLTVESVASERKGALIKLLGDVMKSLRQIPLRRPVSLKPPPLGPPHNDTRLGISVRPPRGWFIASLPTGLQIAQTDYLLDGQPPMPVVQITIAEMPEASDSKTMAQRCMAMARRSLPSGKILDQRPRPLAGLKGYEFVLHKSARPPATSKPAVKAAPAVTIVQRDACEPARNGRAARHYAMTLVCQSGKPGELRRLMDHLVKGFKRLPPPKRPATQPARAGKPASKK